MDSHQFSSSSDFLNGKGRHKVYKHVHECQQTKLAYGLVAPVSYVFSIARGMNSTICSYNSDSAVLSTKIHFETGIRSN